MLFDGNDDDIDFAISDTSRSRLSSLFQGDETHSDANRVLMFQAPKQPKVADNSRAPPGSLSLLHAAAVHAYKLRDGQYTTQGKLGCAILGHHEVALYKILLYKGKQEQVAIVTITAGFNFTVQANNYASFYDEKKENWSLNFGKEDTLSEFAKQVCLAKACSQGKQPTSLVVQDLHYGGGPVLDTGGSADLRYTGWLLSNYTLGEKIDSNKSSSSAYTFRLGKSKVMKGWHKGLLGAQEGSKRMLVLPPDLITGSETLEKSIPSNSVVLYEFSILKVHSKESSSSPGPKSTDVGKKPEVAPRSKSISSQEDNIRMRGASISEQLSQSPKKDKAQLISRMAKMGAAMLPLQGAVPAQPSSSDSEEEAAAPAPQVFEETVPVQTSSPKPAPKPRSRTPSGSSIRESHSTSVLPPSQVPDSGLVNSTPCVSAELSAQSMPHPAGMPLPPAGMSMPHPTAMPMSHPTAMPLHSSGMHASHSAGMPLFSTAMPPIQPPPYASVPSSYQLYHSHPTTMAPSPLLLHGSSYNGLPLHDPGLSVFMSESRAHSTDIKLSLSKISNQADMILNKVDSLSQQPKSIQLPAMENGTLLQNLERIIQENSQMKEEVESKTAKINSLNEKICDLFQKNQRFFEENLLEQKSNSSISQSRITSLEQEKDNLAHQLSEAQFRIRSLEEDLKKAEEATNNLSKDLNDHKAARTQDSKETEELRVELASLQKKLQETENKLESASKKAQLEQEQKSSSEDTEKKLLGKIQELESRLQSLTEKCQSYQEKLKMQHELSASLNQKLSMARQEQPSGSQLTDIRRTMNVLYKLFQSRFVSDQSYTGTEVLELALQTIRSVTMQILEKSKGQSAEQQAAAPSNLPVSVQLSNHQEEVTRPSSEVLSIQDESREEQKEVKETVADCKEDNAEISNEALNVVQNHHDSAAENSLEVPSTQNEVAEERKDTDKCVAEDNANNSPTPGPSPASQPISAERKRILEAAAAVWGPPSDEDDDEDDNDWMA